MASTRTYKITRVFLGYLTFVATIICCKTGFLLSPFLIPTLILSGITWRISTLTDKNEQKSRDDSSQSLYETIELYDNSYFFLYLRPFFSTSKIKKARNYVAPWNYKFHTTNSGYELEDVLQNSTKDILPLLCIGKKGEFFGVGRIEMSEEGWKNEVAELISKSKLIFCMPSSRKGTLWEFDFILENKYLSKTLFIVPGKNQKSLLWQFNSMKNEWFKTQREFKLKYNINLPDYNGKTQLFEIDADNFSILNLTSINLGSDILNFTINKKYNSIKKKVVENKV